MDSITDKYYQYAGFENYEASTTDPGPWMVIGVCLYSISCVLVFLPISVFIGKKCRKLRESPIQLLISDDEAHAAPNDDISNGGEDVPDVVVIQGTIGEINNREISDDINSSDMENQVVIKHHSISWSDIIGAIRQIDCKSGQAREDSSIENCSSSSNSSAKLAKRGNIQLIVSSSDLFQDMAKETGSGKKPTHSDKREKESPNTNIINVYKLHSNATQVFTKHEKCAKISQIVKCDKETQRILRLGGPFTISTVSEAGFDAIILALVSKYLGVEALSAAIVSHLLIGLTDTFVKGIAGALDTLCPHAIGTENYNLAGEYVQIAMVMYIIISLPISVLWWFFMDDAIRVFGMNEQVVLIGTSYSKVLIADYIIQGMFDVFLALLDMTGYASPVMVVALVEGTTSALSLWGLLHFVNGMNLFWLGVTELCVSLFIYSIFGILVVYRGWLDPFWHGMTKTFALKNTSALKNVLQTALPLSMGSLLEYGEWEALTFFAATLGPAEVVAWGILESIWDLFEAATEGLVEAGSMRLAFHLGQRDVEGSKLCSWKTLFLSTILACTLSAIFLILSPYIPNWFTNDKTLVEMVEVQLPLIGVGNIFMVFGMTSWSLIGAQGRYKVATIISATMTICVTLPLATVFCIGMRYSLISLVGAVVIGYSTTGLFLGYILQMSDWLHISKNICALNEKDECSSELQSNSDHADSVEKEYDVFDDNIRSKRLYVQQSRDHTYGGYNAVIKSIRASVKEQLALASYHENKKVDLVILPQEISIQEDDQSANSESSGKIACLAAQIVDLEAQVQEKDSTIEKLREDMRRMQDLYGAELSDILGRIKERVRQTSEVLLGGSTSEKSAGDVSYESSAEQEVQLE